MNLDTLIARGLPDNVLRYAVKKRVARKLYRKEGLSIEEKREMLRDFIADLKTQPIAIDTRKANEQHYEVPAEFFEKVLGTRLKYSSGYWKEDIPLKEAWKQLDQSEDDMFALTCHRAGVENGQTILDLGCGWGSLSFYLAETYPESQITSLSNSRYQREFIEKKAAAKNLTNIEFITADINDFEFEKPGQFDRVISIEMFEHMRNYEKLMEKTASFLKTDGQLFIHIFTHHTDPFLYEDTSAKDWMTRYFFAGGTMPSADLLHYFTKDLYLKDQWAVSGSHYQKTLEAWLSKMDQQEKEIMKLFKETYGKKNARKWWHYWRLFFIACAEFFGYHNGNEWFVSHYLFGKR